MTRCRFEYVDRCRNDQVPIWPDTEFRCLGRVDCSCSTCALCCVTLITNSVIRKGPICDYHKQNISTDVFNVTCLMRLKTFLHIWMFKDTLWYYHLVLIYITCNMCYLSCVSTLSAIDCCLMPHGQFFQLYHDEDKLLSMRWKGCPLY